MLKSSGSCYTSTTDDVKLQALEHFSALAPAAPNAICSAGAVAGTDLQTALRAVQVCSVVGVPPAEPAAVAR